MLSDTDKSDSEELITQIRKWTQSWPKPIPAIPAFGGRRDTPQKDSSAACLGDNRSGVTRAKAEDEVIRKKPGENEARLPDFRWDVRADTMHWTAARQVLTGSINQVEYCRL